MSEDRKTPPEWLEEHIATDPEESSNSLKELDQLWSTSNQIPFPAGENLEAQWQALVQEAQKEIRPKRRTWPLFALAAAILLAAVLWWMQPPRAFATQPGQTQTLTLADGSRVFLNADSNLVLDNGFPDENRSLTLSGEAFFEVAKGAFPFEIKTDSVLVTVKGTQFNVSTRDQTLTVGVVEGWVGLTSLSQPGQSLDLRKGDFIRCAQGQLPEQANPLPNPSFPAWRHNQFFFDQEPFYRVCQEVERHFAIRLEVPPADREIPISGSFQADVLEQSVATLAQLVNRDVVATPTGYRFE